MIENSTVFVLGAGASWHYGYPTGEELVSLISSSADRFSRYCARRVNSGQVVQFVPKYVADRIVSSKGASGAIHGWTEVNKECQRLIRRLHTVKPLLIDHFLAWNESLRPIGKLMIAAAILECEAAKEFRKEWYRYIVHKLVYGCSKSTDLFTNDVHFITFNYDASLEYNLFQALTSVDILEPGDVKRFLTENRIVHPYGCVHRGIPTEKDFVNVSVARSLGLTSFASPLNFAADFEPQTAFLDHCLSAAGNLRAIDPQDKDEDDTSLQQARQWISDASVIYILGYGFDANNNRRIGLDPTIKDASAKVVMFTNFGDASTINKKASKLFLGDLRHFSNVTPLGQPTSRYFEKSVRDVYDALEKDFDALEGELTGSTTI
jgi:hypothetical protein